MACKRVRRAVFLWVDRDREQLPRELTGKLYKRLLRDEYKAAYDAAQAGA